MPKLLIVFFSQTGNTESMAHLVAEGARHVPDVAVEVRSVEQTTPDDLLGADGIIMGSPVYYGTMAAQLKTLIDESVCHHGELVGKVGGAFASSGVMGGGLETTIMDILKCLLIHGMVIAGEARGHHYGTVSVGAPEEAAQAECRKQGRLVAELVAKLHG